MIAQEVRPGLFSQPNSSQLFTTVPQLLCSKFVGLMRLLLHSCKPIDKCMKGYTHMKAHFTSVFGIVWPFMSFRDDSTVISKRSLIPFILRTFNASKARSCHELCATHSQLLLWYERTAFGRSAGQCLSWLVRGCQPTAYQLIATNNERHELFCHYELSRC